MDAGQTDRFVGVLRAEIEREVASRFAFFRSVPSGTTARYMKLFAELSVDDRRQAIEAIARTRATWFGAREDREAQMAISALTLMAFQQQPPPWPHPANTPKARELKKVAALAMSQLLGAKPKRTIEPGELEYAGELDGEPVRVRMRHNVRLVQIEYSIHLARLDADPQFKLTGIGYEQLLGFGIGAWDQVTLGNVDQSFAVLNEVVRRTVAMVAALRAAKGLDPSLRSG